MNYDNWRAREPEDWDDCTGDVRTCGCKGCQAYCDNYEPPAPTDEGEDPAYAPALIDAGRGHLL